LGNDIKDEETKDNNSFRSAVILLGS